MGNPHVDGVDPENNPAAPPAQTPADSDLIPNVPPPVERRRETTHCKPDQTPLWKMILESAAVFLGLYVAGIYGGQLSVMRGTLGEMKRSGEQSTDQVWRAIGNLNWMARSMDWSQKGAQHGIDLSDQQSRKALNATITNFLLEQRPWLGTATDFGVMDIDKPFPEAMNLGVINYGKTFAKKVTLSQHFTLSAMLVTVLPGTQDSTEKSVAVLAPNAPSVIRVGPLDRTAKLKDIYPSFAVTNNWYFYVWGEITYRDVFHPPGTHHTQFCFYRKLSVTGAPNQCEMHNDAD